MNKITFRATLAERAVLGRDYNILGICESDSRKSPVIMVVVGATQVVKERWNLEIYEQPAHFHKKDAMEIVAELNSGSTL